MRQFSRYAGTRGIVDPSDGLVYLTDRRLVSYRPYSDNFVYRTNQGDTLHSIAYKFYASLGNPPDFSAASLFYVVGDFQPEDADYLNDPTTPIPVGTYLVLPSVRRVREEILPAVRAGTL